jgi:hemolysin III
MASIPSTYQAASSLNPSHTTLAEEGLLHHHDDDYYPRRDSDDPAADDNHPNSKSCSSSSWFITDWGHVGEFSRDGSPHATDEVFNASSHLAATMLSILGTVLLVTEASAQKEPWKIVSFSIYGASLIFLFVCSTLHHAIVGPCERLFRIMDYLAIYPLIAGTFTPLCLVFYHDSTVGWVFCMTVWFIAILGMLMTATHFEKIPKWLSMTMYITLGWFGACMTYWLIPVLGWSGFALFLCGGVVYTIGGYVYTTEQPNPIPGKFGFHELWHIAVIVAAASHWLLMYFFVLPER